MTVPATKPPRLTTEDVQRFNDRGYIVPDEPVFSQPRFDALRAHFEDKLTEWTAAGGKSPEHMDTPHFADPKLFDWLLADEVLDLVEPLIGPDIALWTSHFICKPAGTGKRVPWHEDSAYWGKVLDPMDVVTVWLAIDPSTPGNGCMRVIPGTHGDGFSEYHDVDDPDRQVFSTEIDPSKVREDQAVDMILKPNHCSIHHAKLIHGSNANTGPLRRCGYTMRYMPTTVKYRPELRNIRGFDIYLARGSDKAGNNYGDPTRPNQAWLDIQKDEEARRRMKSLGH
jgi:Phytanoyl-CoA dioxygenase (PhyH)